MELGIYDFAADSFTIMVLEMSGFERRCSFSIQVKKIMSLLLVTCLVTALFFVAASGMINWSLSDLYGMSIYISLVNIKTICISSVILSVSFLICMCMGIKKYLNKVLQYILFMIL